MKKPKKNKEISNKVLKIITDYFLESRDFNGIPIESLQRMIKQDWFFTREILKELITLELVCVIDEETDVNPHIIRRGFGPISYQIEKLEKDKPNGLCIYPHRNYLEHVVDKKKYSKEPYKLPLALGESQLSYRSFDLSILEFYRNDPRYMFVNDDIRGHITYNADDLHEKDQILLQSFGFSYDPALNRAVAVFLCYLHDLTPEHQLIWQTKEEFGDYKLHPGYYRNMVIGDWDVNVPIFNAILHELYIINQMCDILGRPHLFNEDFGEWGERRPKKFGFLIRPTLSEFNDFILLFDKMLSENINKSFFKNEISYEKESERNDGKILVDQKGTIILLDEWMRKFFEPPNWDFWVEDINILKKVRQLRQKPAHSIKEDQFDQKYFKEQRDLIVQVYFALRDICQIFACHPRVKRTGFKLEDWLLENKVWDR